MLFLGEGKAFAHAVRAVGDGASRFIVPAGALVIGEAAQDHRAADADDAHVAVEQALELVAQADVRSVG
jgi:hypothetical protein